MDKKLMNLLGVWLIRCCVCMCVAALAAINDTENPGGQKKPAGENGKPTPEP